MPKFKNGDHIRNIYNGQRFLVIEVNTNTFSDGYYIIKGESYPHKDKKWMLFFDAENEWKLISNKKWKPSENQMEAMDTLIVNLDRNPLLLDNFAQANLRTLHDDLKKLKENKL